MKRERQKKTLYFYDFKESMKSVWSDREWEPAGNIRLCVQHVRAETIRRQFNEKRQVEILLSGNYSV